MEFSTIWKGIGVSVDEAYYLQFYNEFKKNIENDTLPFFNKDLNSLPRELTTGKLINDRNAFLLEQVASSRGYKSNIWICGEDLNAIQKKVGSLGYVTRKTQAVLCFDDSFMATSYQNENIRIAEVGAKQKYQYMYNIDCLDNRSKEKVLKYYNQLTTERNEIYQKENTKNFMNNINHATQEGKKHFNDAKERTKKNSIIKDIDFSSLINAHFKHFLKNSVDSSISNSKFFDTSASEEKCYKNGTEYLSKIKTDNEKIKAGKELAKTFQFGTELQRIGVAKDYNLENAKLVEEMQIAETRRNYTARKSSEIERN